MSELVELYNGQKVSYPVTDDPMEILRRFIEAFSNEPMMYGAKAVVYQQAKRVTDSVGSELKELDLHGQMILLKLDSMISNPPGLNGIHCQLGHVGNKYVDEGWKAGLEEFKKFLLVGKKEEK